MDLVAVIRLAFLLMTSTIVLANALPGVQERFIAYGARLSSVQGRAKQQKVKPIEQQKGSLVESLLNALSSLRVPHGWFIHFYLVSFSLSIFWALQWAFDGFFFKAIAAFQSDHKDPSASMTKNQVLLVWSMMLSQGARRLYESYAFTRPTSSTMWIAHWAVGILFYICMSVAIWIEGIGKQYSQPSNNASISHRTNKDLTDVLTIAKLSPRELLKWQPTLKCLIAIPVFLVASGIQYDCHQYLSSLKKYSLPTHPVFTLVVCPHYTAECLIYLSMSIAAAPPGRLINGTIFSGLAFVAVNLGVTAKITRKWYSTQFGENQIRDRWTMIPLIW